MNLFERFEVLEDPRDVRGKKYKLIDILIMTIYGLLCGLTDYTNIADFMKLKEATTSAIISDPAFIDYSANIVVQQELAPNPENSLPTNILK